MSRRDPLVRLRRGYDLVDMDILWEALQSNVPQLLEDLDSILDTE